MGADRLRVLALAIVALTLVIISTWVMDWFTFEISNIAPRFAVLNQVEYVGMGLRDVTVCTVDGMCESRSWSSLATAALWTSTLYAVVIAIQGWARTITNQGSGAITKLGYAVGIASLGAAFLTAFFFNPEVGLHKAAFGMGVLVERTWAPHLLMLGIVVGMFALHYAVHHDTQATRVDDAPPELPAARALISQSIRPVTRAPAEESQPIRRSVTRLSTPIPRLEPALEALVGKLKYAMSQAEITRGGIDARREDRSNVLVMWRDVVGIVARRMPAAHESLAFADVVSSAGSTLRLVPWTRLSGDAIEGDGEPRVRAFIELVIARCPEVRVDRATRDFLDKKSAPAQLPDLETLAVHDSKLA